MKEKAEKADTFAEEAVAATLSGMPLTKVQSELIATPVMARKSPRNELPPKVGREKTKVNTEAPWRDKMGNPACDVQVLADMLHGTVFAGGEGQH